VNVISVIGADRAEALNRDIAAARGDWILVLDPRLVPPPGFLDRCQALVDSGSSRNRYYVVAFLHERWHPRTRGLLGLILARKDALEAAGGYDARYRSARAAQVDLRCALARNNQREMRIPGWARFGAQSAPGPEARFPEDSRLFMRKWKRHPPLARPGVVHPGEHPLYQRPPPWLRRQRDAPKVFAVGLPRTGTKSVSQALELLGLRTVHYGETWEDVLAHDAAADSPIATFYPELDRAFPKARFVLTVRDPNRWADSYARLRGSVLPSYREIQRRPGVPPMNRHSVPIYDESLRRIYRTPSQSREALLAAFDRHSQAVRARFADRPGKLLILDIEQPGAFARLAAFLGKQAPSGELPQSNDAQSLSRALEAYCAIYEFPRA
jgi:hypothetical protein